MQRGVIQLTNSEVRLAQSIASQIQSVDGDLVAKLQAAAAVEDVQESVSLSLQEAETLLDALPPPAEAELETLTNLRKKLTNFVSALENS